ncbi:MAG: lipopolysaccharide kinase InaA family protein [Isosphaeraceae bacterium]|nr:lipopolysaccharide kinase InaA family protein [Isosphaeraceae bacterium]
MTAAGERMFEPPTWAWSRSGDTGWWVLPAWRGALLDEGGLRLDRWRAEGRLTTVKTGPHRVVYRADLPEGSIYVKHFLVPDIRAKVRQWFRRGKGRNEGRRALELAAIGVHTINPIALGEQRKRFFLLENYLITPAIPDTVPLDEFVERRIDRMDPDTATRLRQEVAVGLAELTAHLHDAGFIHQDFHPGNVLVRLDEHGKPQLSLIDLDALRRTHRLSPRAARKNLALLNNYFWSRCGRSDRYRFLKTYLEARNWTPPDIRWFAREIENDTRSWAERLWRRWGRRCRGTNKYFKRYRDRRRWAIASRDLDRTVVRSLMADPVAPFGAPGTRILKDSRTTTVAELEMIVNDRPTTVIYKRFKPKKSLEWLLNIVRPTRAWRAWQAGQHLVSRGLPTPRNLAIIERTTAGLPIPLETFLATVKAVPSTTLYDYAHSVLPTLEPEARRAAVRSICGALARLLRTMHERSISDRDLKAANILVEGDPVAGDPRLSLIDLVGVQLLHPIPRHRRLQNLARLEISLADFDGRTRTDALRFLRAYLPWGLSPHNDWKRIWREVARLCDKKRSRNRKRGRLIS